MQLQKDFRLESIVINMPSKGKILFQLFEVYKSEFDDIRKKYEAQI